MPTQEKIIDTTMLGYYHQQVNPANANDLQALEDKVDEIISEGGEPNVIETVKVNGTALTPVNKAVDVEVPTKTSDLTNDGDGTSNFATEDYVDENGGKIDVIKHNDNTLPITNKEVAIKTATATYDESTHSVQIYDYKTKDEAWIYVNDDEVTFDFSGGAQERTEGSAYTKGKVDTLLADKTDETKVQEMIDDSLAGITGIDFQIVTELPATGKKGIFYLIQKEGTAQDIYDEYIWIEPTGSAGRFEYLGTTQVDLSDYWDKETYTIATASDIDAILNA